MKITWTNAKHALFIGMIVYGVYDFGLFTITGEATTISQAMTDYLHLSPFGSFVIGMILGHWWWPMLVKPSYERLKKAWWGFSVEKIGADHELQWDELEAAILELTEPKSKGKQ